MRQMTRRLSVLVLCASLASPAAGAAAAPGQQQPPQTQHSASDVARLEALVGDIERLAVGLKSSDPTLAAQVSRTLAELRDEVTYLRVKVRREGSISRDDYQPIADRLETLRMKARGEKMAGQPLPDDPVSRMWTVSVDTQLDVRLQTPLNSGTVKVEQRFEATTILDYSMNGTVIIPAGSVVRGFVSSVRPAGRVDRTGSITLSFDELRIDNRSYRLRASVVHAREGKMSEDATRIGVGAVAGGIIGGILGGLRGALVGVIVGGGGAIAATEGADVDLPVGTILRIRFDQPVDIVR